jgi:HEXXH motif-containing protein
MPTVHPLSEIEVDVQSKYVEEALRIIKEVDEGSYEEIQEYTSHIVLFDGLVLVGITSMRAFGKIYIRIPEQDLSEEEKVAYYIEHIVHEGAHLHLHGIMMHARLVLNSDEERFPAPIRADLRPMYGIFHATFVLSRMARVFRKWNEASGLDVAHTEYEKALSRFERGYETVARHARLTEAGKKVVATLRQAALMEPQ